MTSDFIEYPDTPTSRRCMYTSRRLIGAGKEEEEETLFTSKESQNVKCLCIQQTRLIAVHTVEETKEPSEMDILIHI